MLSASLVASLALTTMGVAPQPAAAHEPQGDAIIDNGTVRLGIHPQGHFNVRTGSEFDPVGVQYIPTGNEATAPGCLCEGWGAGAADLDTSGFANEDSDGGAVNLEVESFTTTASTAESVVIIREGGGGAAAGAPAAPASAGNRQDRDPAAQDQTSAPAAVGDPLLRVTHDYHPSITPNLYEATVTIENVSTTGVADLRYRRVMDWDVEPTPFSEHVTISGGADNLLYSSNDGFATANPLGARSNLGSVGPPEGTEFEDVGPDDHGALFDFGFGALDAGASTTFNIYYGAGGTEAEALDAVAAVGAEVYSFGQPSTEGGFTEGTPNTFIFGFTGVGGAGEIGRDPRPPLRLVVRQAPFELVGEGGVAPFDVTSNVHNVGDGTATDVETAITLGPDLTLTAGANPSLVPGPDGPPGPDPGTLGPGEVGEHTWSLQATQGCEEKTSFYEVTADYGERLPEETPRLVRNEIVIPGTCGALAGLVSATGFGPLANAEVDVCPVLGGDCVVVFTDSSGRYQTPALASGSYRVTGRPPVPAPEGLSADTLPRTINGVNVVVGSTTEQDIELSGLKPPPEDTSIAPSSPGIGGIPVVYWLEDLEVSTEACANGNGTPPPADAGLQLVQGGTVIQSAAMVETPVGSGHYEGTITQLHPLHGYATVQVTIYCPDGAPPEVVDFNIYIDPSGFVRTVEGDPLPGATVTLLRSDTIDGVFTVVPDGSVIMSPANRTNPDVTDAEGHFGWDVIAGFYKVRAEKEGCTAPVDRSVSFVETAVLTIPPPVTDLDIRLDCSPPATVPEVPTDVVAVAGNGSATIRWTAPDDGGSAITGYTVVASPGGASVTVGGDATSATVTGLTNGTTYTFVVTAINAVGASAATAPSNAVTPSLIAPACPAERVPASDFGDIAGNIHASSIECIAWYAITLGVTPQQYRPALDVKRDQLASFLARMIEAAGVELAPATDQGFTDIAGNVHAERINQLAAVGISLGRTPTSYAPSASVPREQMATFLVRTFEFISEETLTVSDDHFGDDDASVHQDSINKAAEAGFTFGTSATAFSPREPVRRDQMSSFLARALSVLVERGHATPKA